jgi:ABC-type transport system involved in multi-copper enzyme maturation permease subunit
LVVTPDNSDKSTDVHVSVFGLSDGIGVAERRKTLPSTTNKHGDHDRMFGPLYYYELVRLARKGRSTAVRCGYALAVFATLFFVYRDRFPHYSPILDPFAAEATQGRELARLANDFVMAVLVVQTVAILVLTPAYLAGSIAGEKERGTLDLLFMTHLTDREIVLGKLAAHVTHLGGVFLAGLPLLAVTQLWGGVDFSALLAALWRRSWRPASTCSASAA